MDLDVLLELGHRYPLAAAILCTAVLAAVGWGVVLLGRREEAEQAEGNAEALAYLRKHGEPMPGWPIPFTLEELEEITSSGTLHGRPVRFNVRDAQLLLEYLRKQQKP